MVLQFYHWMILGALFWVADLLKLGRLTTSMVFAAVVQAIITYLNPGLWWMWQLWSFIMMTAIGAIIYMKRNPREDANAEASRKLSEGALAESLVGTTVLLMDPLYPGTSKLEVGGRFWKVSANRDFPGNCLVEVVGHRGNTLEITSSDVPSYGDKPTRTENIALELYERDDKVEREYGTPNFGYWNAFQDGLLEHRKLALVYAYHVLCGLKGMNLEEAQAKLNTYTLALYDTNRPGKFLTFKKQMYSQPRMYSFLYMDGEWPGSDMNKFEAEINSLIAALHTPWAEHFRGEVEIPMALRAVMMIRKQQVAAAT
ncbi:MAG: NfeD family protein [Halieaceae bacterium]